MNNFFIRQKFYWLGIKNQQKSSGIIQARNRLLAEIELETSGIKIEKIYTYSIILHIWMWIKNTNIFTKNIFYNKDQEILLFTSFLAKLLTSGTDLISALKFIQNELKNNEFKKIIDVIIHKISLGVPFSQALKMHPKYFDTLYCALIYSAEHCGKLLDVLCKILEYKRQDIKLRQELKKNVMYPIFLLLIAFSMFLVILFFVIPEFKNIFTDLEASLPLLTQIIINFTDNITTYIFASISLLIISYITIKHLRDKYGHIALFIDEKVLKLPFIGKTILQITYIRFAYIYKMALSSGLSVIDAQKISIKNFENRFIISRLNKMFLYLDEGHSFYFALQKTQIFSSLMLQMLLVAEKAGTLEDTFAEIYKIYSMEIEQKLSVLNTLLEPILILIITLMFGILIIAMYLPMFKFGSII